MSIAVGQEAAEARAYNYRWVVILTWMLAHMWAFLIVESTGILLPSMREELGLTPIQEGWLGASPQIAALFCPFPAPS